MTDWLTDGAITARLGAPRLKQIFDDDNDGTPDDAVLDQLRHDAQGWVESALIGPGSIYPSGIPGLAGLAGTAPPVLIKIGLDAVFALAAQRHPEVMRVEWKDYVEAVDKELDRIRMGKRGLGITTTPEPAANNGGKVEADATDCVGAQVTGLDVPRTFLDGLGDF